MDSNSGSAYLAVALRVHPIHFLPKMDWSKPVKAQIYSQ
jgi:hypothetical protein